MSFNIIEKDHWLNYLLELRRRILLCVIVWLAVFIVLYYFSPQLYSKFASPIGQLLNNGHSLIATSLTATFVAPLKLAMTVSCLICVPLFFQQLWGYICPALYHREKHLARLLLGCSIVLFYLGLAFAYYFVYPLILNFFIKIAPTGVAVTPEIGSFLNFSLTLFFAFGLAFEVPVIIIILICSGLVSATQLANYRPYIIVLNFIIAMFLTPPDVVSQILLAIPLCLLFEIGLFLAKHMQKIIRNQ